MLPRSAARSDPWARMGRAEQAVLSSPLATTSGASRRADRRIFCAAATGRRLRSAISAATTAMGLLSVAPQWLGDQGREWPPSTSHRQPYLRSTTYLIAA